MLEILFLVFLGRNIAAIAKRKNRGPVGYVLLLVLGWFCLGIGFGIVAMAIALAGGMNEDQALGPMVLGYLFGAACAVGLAYLVVGMVPPLDRGYGYDYDDAPEVEDYNDRPRRRRPPDEELYDDDPRARRRSRDDDGDDYDRPRRRRDDY